MSTLYNSTDDTYIDMIKTVCNFTKDGYLTVKKMIVDEFLLAYKHAVIDSLMKTEEGQKVLKDYDRLNKTEPDVDKLRNLFGKG